MQKRHNDRLLYFSELSKSSEKFLIPYIDSQFSITSQMEILEVGCGEGGNLLPFAQMGGEVCGVDISSQRICQAKSIFADRNISASFIHTDIFQHNFCGRRFDVIICHDVIEHIAAKTELLIVLKSLLKEHGVIFFAFPPWQMPFGGHQQICRSPIPSHFPYIHLLPGPVYRLFLRLFRESDGCVKELSVIKNTGLSIDAFKKIVRTSGMAIAKETCWMINPYYYHKFSLKPRRLAVIGRIPYLRNFLTSSYWCILKPLNIQ